MKKEFCRVCGEESEFVFEKPHLKKYSVKYYRCKGCASMQTEAPYWLPEAYAFSHYCIDTGICERGRVVSQHTLALALLTGFKDDDLCIDIGGGTGLLTRNLRDYGLNAYWSDKYSNNIFAVGFEKAPSIQEAPKLLTAFEVFEHFPQPQEEVALLMSYRPEFLLFSTKLYKGQESSWWYFLNDGQHVQLYSEKGLAHLAAKHHYHFYTNHDTFHLFARDAQRRNIMKKISLLAPKAESKARKRWGSRTYEDHRQCLALFE